MKNILLICITVFLLFSSCSFFQGKDKLLTQEKWILHMRSSVNYANAGSSSGLKFFKRADEVLTLKFNMNGTAIITENNNEKVDTILWKWKSEDKKYITLDRGKYIGVFSVSTLKRKSFTWSKYNKFNLLERTDMEFFKHFKDKEWDDENVDVYNKISNTYDKI
jgi:hypothetical protein